MELSELTREHFASRLGETFRAGVDEGVVVELELTSAEEREAGAATAFSILFEGPAEPFLRQRIYELEHAELGTLPIFLVPIGQTEEGFVYEAVFTRA